jgi:predicted CXXCH cytochrome family protein
MMNCSFKTRILYALIFIFLGTVSSANAAKCTSNKCHPDIGKNKFVHGPVIANACEVCHIVGDKHRPPKQHDLTYPKEGAALCLECHEEFESGLKGLKQHGPVADGECTICHDPHQEDDKFFLRETTHSELCFSCHEDNMSGKKHVHKPVKDGDCIACHDAHGSTHDFLLETDRVSLCFSCHEDRKADFEKKYVHKPVKESCEKCHDPHSSSYKGHLIKAEKDLCSSCHEKFVKKFNNSQSQHSAVLEKGCASCHSPHSSNNDKGLKIKKQDLCLSCHEKLKNKISDSQYLHGPVAEGDCGACHDSHATNFAKHLRDKFPDEFYFPYNILNYALCFQCHNKEVATSEKTETLTNFRNGKQNLHFLHVNREKGRSCKACHEVHAGNQEKHIAFEVPFGKSSWMLPIKFTKTETGGGCQVGCHKMKEYDRVKPFEYTEE